MLSKDELLLEASIMMDARVRPLDRRLKVLEKIQDDALLARLQNKDARNATTCQQYQRGDEHTESIQCNVDNPKKIVVEITIGSKN